MIVTAEFVRFGRESLTIDGLVRGKFCSCKGRRHAHKRISRGSCSYETNLKDWKTVARAGRKSGDLNAMIRRAGDVAVEYPLGEAFQRATSARMRDEGGRMKREVQSVEG